MRFRQEHLHAIAAALGDTDEGLKNSEIDFLLKSAKLKNPGPGTKRDRIYNAFVEYQNRAQTNLHILAFIRKALKPARFLGFTERFEPMRANVNRALAFTGLYVDESGKLDKGGTATTLSEAERRASELRRDLASRGTHPDVLDFCRAELIADNYFHAVQEAVKSVIEKLRKRTGLIDDGNVLFDRVFGGETPILIINAFNSMSEMSEQKGFVHLLKGTYGTFRNPTAHAARKDWEMKKEDAEDLLSLLSFIHRRIDKATMPPRI
ncbi:TIGR02391 family protein [Bauldia litoralis]|uniref:TIGR02391 family protein n=1 Tax=Bauldia litoralis TaxID=665467 RepID=UPI003265D369